METSIRSWHTLSWMFFLGTGFLLSFQGIEPSATHWTDAGSAPVWQVNVHSLGYDDYVPPREFLSRGLLDPLSFTSENELIVSFLTRGTDTTLRQENRINEPLALQLHAFFLEPSSGAVSRKQKWPTSHPQVDLVAGRSGTIVVILPDRVLLYSRNLELISEAKLPSDGQTPEIIRAVDVSPQGGSLLLKFMSQAVKFRWFDTTSLQVLASGEETLADSTVSDQELALGTETFVKSSGFLSEVKVHGINGSHHVVCGGYSNCGTPRFINNDVIALLGSHQFKLVGSKEGGVVFSYIFRGDEWIYPGNSRLRASANGSRFALPIWNLKGGSTLLDISAHAILKSIKVFDVPSRQCVYTLDVKKLKVRRLDGLALSPDGSEMATLIGSLVRFYQIPTPRLIR